MSRGQVDLLVRVFSVVMGIIGVVLFVNRPKSKVPSPEDNMWATTETTPPTRVYVPPANPTRVILPPVTKRAYSQCQIGMSYQQCKAIIGWEGKVVSESSYQSSSGDVSEEITMTQMQWMNSDGSNMVAIFNNWTLTDKGQIGLPE